MFGLYSRISDRLNLIDYWISKDANLHGFLDKSKEELLSKGRWCYSSDLTEDLSKLYEEENASEKAMVLTVLATTKMYFDD